MSVQMLIVSPPSPTTSEGRFMKSVKVKKKMEEKKEGKRVGEREGGSEEYAWGKVGKAKFLIILVIMISKTYCILLCFLKSIYVN